MVRVLPRFGLQALAILLVVAAGCAPAASPTAPEGPPQHPPAKPLVPSLRVATYNINFGNAALDEVASAIRQANADIVCLQETNAASAAVLRRDFAQEYPHTHFSGDVSRYAAGGFGILSRWPILREECLPAKHGLFGTSVSEIQRGDLRVQIINVHLQPVLFRGQKDLAGLLAVLASFQAAEEIHASEMTSILPHVRTDMPALMVGDFNSGSTFQAPKLAVKHGLVDSFAAVNTDPDLHPTWRWPVKNGEVTLRIDYIFHSPTLRTTASRVVRTAGSDHMLVVSHLEVIDSKKSGIKNPLE